MTFSVHKTCLAEPGCGPEVVHARESQPLALWEIHKLSVAHMDEGLSLLRLAKASSVYHFFLFFIFTMNRLVYLVYNNFCREAFCMVHDLPPLAEDDALRAISSPRPLNL